MAALTTSASAVDIYSTTPEAEPFLKSSALMTIYDSGISTAAVEPSDLDEYLLSSGSYLSNNGTINGGSYSPTSTVADLIRNGFSGLHYNVIDITKTLYDLLRGSGKMPNGVGGVISGTNVTLWNLISEGFLSNSYILNDIEDLITNFPNYTSKLNDIITSLSLVRSSVDAVNTSVGSLQSALLTQLETRLGETYVNSDNTETSSSTVKPRLSFILRNGLLAINRTLTLNLGEAYLHSNSSESYVASAKARLSYIVSQGFLGLGNLLQVDPYELFLNDSGVTEGIGNASGRLSWLIRMGFLGISSNIKGSEIDNVYTSTLNDNNNSTTTVNSTGLGPLLNTQLSNIGENLGHLAFVFASDEDIKLREDSQPLLDTTDSFYDDSDSNVKISTNNVGSLKDIAGNFTSIIDADADIGDTFAIVSNSNTYRWFSADTAMNLDSLGVAAVDFEESTYDRLHREFNEIYFPDRVGGAS